jgi:hypothetical protein
MRCSTIPLDLQDRRSKGPTVEVTARPDRSEDVLQRTSYDKLFASAVVGALTPLLDAAPDVRIYKAAAFSAGHPVVGYVLGGVVTLVALLVSTTDICIPSMIYRSLFGWERARDAQQTG